MHALLCKKLHFYFYENNSTMDCKGFIYVMQVLIINISINPLLVSTYDQHEIKTGTTHWKCLPP